MSENIQNDPQNNRQPERGADADRRRSRLRRVAATAGLIASGAALTLLAYNASGESDNHPPKLAETGTSEEQIRAIAANNAVAVINAAASVAKANGGEASGVSYGNFAFGETPPPADKPAVDIVYNESAHQLTMDFRNIPDKTGFNVNMQLEGQGMDGVGIDPDTLARNLAPADITGLTIMSYNGDFSDPVQLYQAEGLQPPAGRFDAMAGPEQAHQIGDFLATQLVAAGAGPDQIQELRN